MQQTIAFNNRGNFWKTRYSYIPSCMMHVNKLFFTSPDQKVPGDQKTALYRHNDSSNSYNQFYNDDSQSLPSALAVSFNGFTAKSMRGPSSNTSSSNKIFKSFSISGLNTPSATENLTLGVSSFIVNNNSSSQAGSEGHHRLTPLKRKGNSVYGDIGQEIEMSGTNIKAIGKIKNVYRWFSYNADEAVNEWFHLTPLPEDVESPTDIPIVQISELHVDAEGIDKEPNISPVERLYAFEIESFMSNNPLPSASTGDNFSEFVKFFSGRVNEELNGMASTPYRTLAGSEPYTVLGARYLDNFQESTNFSGGEVFESYLSYGDPFSDEDNSFKKGKYLMLLLSGAQDVNHLPYERTPGCQSNNDLIGNFTWNAGGNVPEQLVLQGREVLYAMTPGIINGADPHGSFADAFVILGSNNFEVSSLQVEFEFTEYDHGGQTSAASKASAKK